jgi:hypothetical protein
VGIPVEKGFYFLFVEGFALDKQKIKPQITANPKEASFNQVENELQVIIIQFYYNYLDYSRGGPYTRSCSDCVFLEFEGLRPSNSRKTQS